MSYPQDIRPYKKEIRDRCRAYRKRLTREEHAAMDSAIVEQFLATDAYRNAKTVLCYVSIPGEIDTHQLISRMAADGKQVAVPRCIEGTRKMDFYRIDSVEGLIPQRFGLLEPDPDNHELLSDFSQTVCIVPGLSFDWQGYRIGYGGGYYDRFLSAHPLDVLIGVCYSQCVFPELVHGRYDIPCDMLVTENELRVIPK